MIIWALELPLMLLVNGVLRCFTVLMGLGTIQDLYNHLNRLSVSSLLFTPSF